MPPRGPFPLWMSVTIRASNSRYSRGRVGGDDDLLEEGSVHPERPVDEALAPDLDEGLVDAAHAAGLAAGQDDSSHKEQCLSV